MKAVSHGSVAHSHIEMTLVVEWCGTDLLRRRLLLVLDLLRLLLRRRLLICLRAERSKRVNE
jgi:hypothetical protein